MREFDLLGEDIAALDKEIASSALTDPAIKRLITITGIADGDLNKPRASMSTSNSFQLFALSRMPVRKRSASFLSSGVAPTSTSMYSDCGSMRALADRRRRPRHRHNVALTDHALAKADTRLPVRSSTERSPQAKGSARFFRAGCMNDA